mmetsp:Transcript_60049/g.142336  ORF Transcript_60049/g.142336 Transcript_60049/m.142336 type:complete len:405 (+) Transcript_60049:572-1786(+)
MHSPQDLRLAHPLRNPRVPVVDEAHEAEAFGTLLGHDGALRPRVDERLHLHAVHLGVDVEHDDPPERLRVELHRSFVVRVHVLHPDRFLDLLLRLDVHGVHVESHDRRVLLGLSVLLGFRKLEKLLGHRFRVAALERVVQRGVAVPDAQQQVRVGRHRLQVLVRLVQVTLHRVHVPQRLTQPEEVGGGPARRSSRARRRGALCRALLHHEHVSVLHSRRIDAGGLLEGPVFEEELLLCHRDSELHLKDGGDVLDSLVGVNLHQPHIALHVRHRDLDLRDNRRGGSIGRRRRRRSRRCRGRRRRCCRGGCRRWGGCRCRGGRGAGRFRLLDNDHDHPAILDPDLLEGLGVIGKHCPLVHHCHVSRAQLQLGRIAQLAHGRLRAGQLHRVLNLVGGLDRQLHGALL